MYFQLLFWPVSDILFEVAIADPFEWTKLKVLNSVDVRMLVVIGRHTKRCFDLKPVVMRACRSQFLCQFPFTTGNADHCHRKRSFFFFLPWKIIIVLGIITPVAQMVKHLPAMQETWVQSLGQEDSPGEGNDYPL